MKTNKIILMVLPALFSSSLLAGTLTVPNTFLPGASAVAGEVNTNFTAVKAAVDDNDSRITSNNTNVSTNTSNIGSNTIEISTVSNSATTNAIAINQIQTTTVDLLNRVVTYEEDGTTVINAGDVIDLVEGSSFIRHLVGGEVFMAGTTIFAIDRFYRVTTEFATSSSPAVITDLSPYSSNLQAVSLTGSDGVTKAFPSADNPLISVNCATGASLQAAIENAPTTGKVVITISGDCNDDIFLRRSGITIQGDPNNGADSITGNATGFSSSPGDGYNYDTSASAVGLVQRQPNTGASGMPAAFEVRDRRATLKDLTINAGANYHALRMGNGSKIKLVDVTLNGHNYGARVFNNSVLTLIRTTVTTDGSVGIDGSGNSTCNNPFCGSGIFASTNSSIILKSGNAISGASNANDGYALAAINGVAISLRGANNNLESLSIISSNFEQTRFEGGGTDNQIRGDLEVCVGSSFIAQQISINANSGESEIGVCGQSTMVLEPRSANAISVTTEEIEVVAASTFIVSDGDYSTPFPVSFAHSNGSNNKIEIEVGVNSSFVNENGGSVPANFDLYEHSSVSLDAGTTIDGNVGIYELSSFFSENGTGSNITGNLTITGFSTYTALDQGSSVAAGSTNQSVQGTVTCGTAEAIEYQGNDNNFGLSNDLCSATE